MNGFSPAWAYGTEYPYAQNYSGNTYPGNSVMATTAGQAADMAYGVGGAVVLAALAWYLTKGMKKKKQQLTRYGVAGAAAVAGYFGAGMLTKKAASKTDWSGAFNSPMAKAQGWDKPGMKK